MDWFVLVVAVLWALWVLIAMWARAGRLTHRTVAERRWEPLSHVRVFKRPR